MGDDIAFLSTIDKIFDSDDFKISDIKPSEWAEQNRYMTSDVSSFPGPFSYDRTPYTREIVDTLSPHHPARRVAVMKGAQIGLSTGLIENGIGYIISEQPGPILYTSGSEQLNKNAMDTKIDQMLDSTGLREVIGAQTRRKKNNRTGDTSRGKEFPGGQLITVETSNHKNIRQFSARYGFIDDFETAPLSSKKSGSTMDLIEQRFASYYEKMKVFYISTPELKASSNIEPAFLMGDQRLYHIPCPNCSDYIPLYWKVMVGEKKAGMTWKLDKSGKVKPKSVGYVCQSCGDFFDDSNKQELLNAGFWKPTAQPVDETFYSYHISALYAPVGMFDWYWYASKYVECFPKNAPKNLEKLKTFYNTALGQTWEERGDTPSISQLLKNTRLYHVGTVPKSISEEDGNGQIVLLTCACDLNGVVDDARLDYEIVAWAESGSSYSVKHGSIGTFIPRENTLKTKKDRERWTYEHGMERNVWDEFMKVITSTYENYEGEGSSKIAVVGIDTGQHTKYAYNFMKIASDTGVFILGLKGQDQEAFRKLNKDTHIFSRSKERPDDLFMLHVNQIKDEISANMKLRWSKEDGRTQPIGFMNFPQPSDGLYTLKDYFDHYQSEHKIPEKNTSGQITGYRWNKKNSAVQNHLWDCRVYNAAIREIFAELICRELKVPHPSWSKFCGIMLGKL